MSQPLELPLPRRLAEAGLTGSVVSMTYFAVGHGSARADGRVAHGRRSK